MSLWGATFLPVAGLGDSGLCAGGLIVLVVIDTCLLCCCNK